MPHAMRSIEITIVSIHGLENHYCVAGENTLSSEVSSGRLMWPQMHTTNPLQCSIEYNKQVYTVDF